jgi:hypothetical protein
MEQFAVKWKFLGKRFSKTVGNICGSLEDAATSNWISLVLIGVHSVWGEHFCVTNDDIELGNIIDLCV